MGVTPGQVSQIERGEGGSTDVIARYIEALGGRFDLVASIGAQPGAVPVPSETNPLPLAPRPWSQFWSQFTPVRHCSGAVTGIVFAQAADGGGRG
jgi:hypothetical protein